MWRFGVALAEAGWRADAVDLRGHGSAPRGLDYTIEAYAADLAATVRDDGRAWDLVVGHSLGGAASVVSSASHPSWTSRLVLIDPAIRPTAHDLDVVRASQGAAFADPTPEAVRAEHPQWHEHDVELKALAARQASRWAVEQTSVQNDPWDVRSHLAQVRVPTRIVRSDPAVYSIMSDALVDEILAANPRVTVSVVAGAGHSPHRDKPEDTIAAFMAALEG